MEIPARDFYRYLVLCGRDPVDIHAVFDKNLLMLPPRPFAYYRDQVEWAFELLGTRVSTVPTALRVAGMYDMWAAFKKKTPGLPCRSAYHIASIPNVRMPVEALLLAGFQDWEIVKAINNSLNHYVDVSAEDVAAFRKYFFNSRILGAQDRRHLIMREEHLRVALVGLPSDLLLHALGLRYNEAGDQIDRAYDLALRKWLIHLEATPIRTDREGLKSLSTFLNTLKGLDRASSTKQADDMPLVRILKGEHLALEENLVQ